MTIDIEEIFKYKIPNKAKLIAEGFSYENKIYQKKIPILKKKFSMDIFIEQNGKIRFTVFDNEFGDEYTLIHVENAKGSFIAEIRSACENVLTEIAQKCFDTEILKAEQTKRIISFIKSKYNTEPEFLWESSPNSAVFRRKDNSKWFSIIMTVDKSKLRLTGHGKIEIMDLKATSENVENLLKQISFYPAYHMNKKHWYTVCLNSSILDEQLFSLIEESFIRSGNKN